MPREQNHETHDGQASSIAGHDRTTESSRETAGVASYPDPVVASVDLESVVRHHDGHPGRVDKTALLDRYRGLETTGSRDLAAEVNAGDVTPETYAKAIHELALADPGRAGDWIGELVVLISGFDGTVSSIGGEALDQIGDRAPREFERWIPELVDLAESQASGPRFYGLRSLAQVAPVNPRAAGRGVDAAFDGLTADNDRVRKAAITVIGEVAPTVPEAVPSADREFAAALRNGVPQVRTAAAMAAGRVLREVPNRYPRTATALLDATDAETDSVREFANAALVNVAIEAPHAVPEKERVVDRLHDLEDRDIGVEPGTVASAEIAILRTLAGITT